MGTPVAGSEEGCKHAGRSARAAHPYCPSQKTTQQALFGRPIPRGREKGDRCVARGDGCRPAHWFMVQPAERNGHVHTEVYCPRALNCISARRHALIGQGTLALVWRHAHRQEGDRNTTTCTPPNMYAKPPAIACQVAVPWCSLRAVPGVCLGGCAKSRGRASAAHSRVAPHAGRGDQPCVAPHAGAWKPAMVQGWVFIPRAPARACGRQPTASVSARALEPDTQA